MNVAATDVRQSPQGSVDRHRRRADRELRQRRLGDHGDARAVGRGDEAEAHRLEVDEQRVGPDVVGLERLVVERGGIVRRQPERAAVEHEIAADRLEPAFAQRRDERRPLLDRDLRIAAALEHEVAVEAAVDQRPGQVGLGAPAVIAAEDVERGERRDELHDRRRVHRLLGLVREQRPSRPGLLHDDADVGERNARVQERAADLARQRGRRDDRRERE
jgi:hypothetical protein